MVSGPAGVLRQGPGGQVDPEDAQAWSRLSGEGGGVVSGQSYSRNECFVKALEVDPKHAPTIYNMNVLLARKNQLGDLHPLRSRQHPCGVQFCLQFLA